MEVFSVPAWANQFLLILLSCLAVGSSICRLASLDFKESRPLYILLFVVVMVGAWWAASGEPGASTLLLLAICLQHYLSWQAWHEKAPDISKRQK